MKDFSPSDINRFYQERHQHRDSRFRKRPYANYGYWPRPGMSIDEACDALTDLLAQELAVTGTDRVLDVGCGYGACAVYIIEKYRPQLYAGIDVTDVRIESARALIQERGLDDMASIAYGDATRLDFPDGHFTKILSLECAFHFSTRKDYFDEAFRVLAPGGAVAMTDIVVSDDLDMDAYELDEIRRLLNADTGHICDDNLYNGRTYARHMEESGFVDVRVKPMKDTTVLPFADYMEEVAQASEGEGREARLKLVEHFRGNFAKAGDYVVVTARRPA